MGDIVGWEVVHLDWLFLEGLETSSGLAAYLLPSSRPPRGSCVFWFSWLSAFISILVDNNGVSESDFGWMCKFDDFSTLRRPGEAVDVNLMVSESLGWSSVS